MLQILSNQDQDLHVQFVKKLIDRTYTNEKADFCFPDGYELDKNATRVGGSADLYQKRDHEITYDGSRIHSSSFNLINGDLIPLSNHSNSLESSENATIK